ncbi:MAG TPA: EscU/YscU/HrcU family type III secretion system export apparatus switch protein, partial [Rhizomicrobium sp.]|nr:EscU/YscU/HrcU family type III secretion system export apparatus switch protein [Rhizomicrobium sp.]
MAEEKDKSTQTEEPTQKRLAEAHEHGDVVRSAEVSTFAVLAGGTLAIVALAGPAAVSLTGTMRYFLEQPDRIAFAPGDLQSLMGSLLARLAAILAPFFLLIMAAGLGGNLIQHRPVFTAERIKPDFAKLSLISGFKRMFGTDGLA